jgi:non-heme chloroperoxidase
MNRYIHLILAVLLAAMLGSVATTQEEDLVLKEVTVRGAALRYVAQGEGQPVVFVHGTLSDLRVWLPHVGALAAQRRAVTYSRRYHWPGGDHGDGSDYSYEQHAADLAELIRALELGRADLVGHSYGGFVVALVARDHPELVRRLVLVEPGIYSLVPATPAGDEYRRDLAALARQLPELLAGPDEPLVAAGVEFFIRPGKYAEVPAELRAILLDNAGSFRAQVAAGNLPPEYSCADAGRIAAPTLLVDGAESAPEFGLINDALESCLPGARRIRVAGAGHAYPPADAEHFLEVLREFLRD